MLKRIIQGLKNENDFKEIKHRYKASLFIDFTIILSIPFFFALIFPYQGNTTIDFLRGNYGLVTILALPIYFLLTDMTGDKVRDKITPGFFIMSWNFLMLWMIDKIISDFYLDLNLSDILSTYLPIFSNKNFYAIFVDLSLAPILALYALFTYLILIRLITRRKVAIPKK